MDALLSGASSSMAPMSPISCMAFQIHLSPWALAQILNDMNVMMCTVPLRELPLRNWIAEAYNGWWALHKGNS